MAQAIIWTKAGILLIEYPWDQILFSGLNMLKAVHYQ